MTEEPSPDAHPPSSLQMITQSDLLGGGVFGDRVFLCVVLAVLELAL